ncbi:hypothetical protein EW026_g6542 [Hermanssonia centrifuga]|uniref:Prokaryotic-type class I peptide chain release factors domain-containing protein n=1 Tax=Hermanssonia centrifuga TaxID=98765 RepID=A0A4S4KCF4_9APHY|nr:hypothetical protein EW026_g6542 [Hermanssonia centrifuga]
MRNEILPDASLSDKQVFSEKITLAREIAEVLRKNVVQARKVENPDSEKEKWQLQITKHTELGDNDSIKSPPPVESSRSARKRTNSVPECNNATTISTPSTSDAAPTIPRYYSQLKKAHKSRTVPELKEEDLEEKFVRGSGPGGQSINKTENNVQLLHKPTGIRVNCQETRSLSLNRHYARKILLDKLDKLQNPGLSKQELLKAKQLERDRRRRKKAKKKNKERASLQEQDEDED